MDVVNVEHVLLHYRGVAKILNDVMTYLSYSLIVSTVHVMFIKGLEYVVA